MCELCKDFPTGFRPSGPREYKDLARKLWQRELLGEIVVTNRAGILLKEVLESPTWPSDIIDHHIQCSRCGAKFELFADTYHGSVSWSGEI